MGKLCYYINKKGNIMSNYISPLHFNTYNWYMNRIENMADIKDASVKRKEAEDIKISMNYYTSDKVYWVSKEGYLTPEDNRVLGSLIDYYA